MVLCQVHFSCKRGRCNEGRRTCRQNVTKKLKSLEKHTLASDYVNAIGLQIVGRKWQRSAVHGSHNSRGVKEAKFLKIIIIIYAVLEDDSRHVDFFNALGSLAEKCLVISVTQALEFLYLTIN